MTAPSSNRATANASLPRSGNDGSLTSPLALDLLERARALAGSQRRLLGIVGPPGSGKTTLATWLARELGPTAAYVPMDGFHLANRELARLGLSARKGSPPSFDAAGFAHAMRRLAEPTETVYLPAFEHAGINEAIAGAIPIPPKIGLVIVEGIYLLLDERFWTAARAILHPVWYIDVAEDVCRERLIRRHIATGREPDAARAWVEENDLPNLRLIETTRGRADLVVEGTLLG